MRKPPFNATLPITSALALIALCLCLSPLPNAFVVRAGSRPKSVQDQDTRTPLHHAARDGDVEAARRLIARGADVNARANGAHTPLMAVASYGEIEMVRFLLAQGADPTLRDAEGRTASDRARQNGHAAVVSVLEAALSSGRDGGAVPTTAPSSRPSVSEGSNQPGRATQAEKLRVGEEVIYRGGGPLWFGGARVEGYDAAKRQYQIRTRDGSGDILPCHSVARRGQVNNDFFVGNWAVFVSGAASTFEKGGDLYRRFSGGARLPPLEIKADGTYVWRDPSGKTISGSWEDRKDGFPGITILKGLDGIDWTVYENTEGYAPTGRTVDEIRFHHMPTSTGYYVAYRIGENKSCALDGRTFGQ